MKNELPSDSVPKPPHGVAVQRGVIPQPGETWTHHYHGPVKIIRKWNDKESVCEKVSDKRRHKRRLLLMNELMRRGG